MATQATRVQFTVDDFYRMAEAGIFDEDDRVELIEGDLFWMSPVHGPHIRGVNRATQALSRNVGDLAAVSVQNSVRLGDMTEPVPDLSLLRANPEGVDPPLAAGVLLVFEIADSSLARDRDVKMPLYARAGIPEAWIADLNGDAILRYTEPRDGTYTIVERYDRGAAITLAVLPSVTIAVDDILG